MQILFAYVDGYDLHDVADEIEQLCDAFVASRRWEAGNPWVVNQRLGTDELHTSNDLPEWEVGINMPLPEPGHEPLRWFSDVEAIAMFLGALHVRTGREFVIGIADTEHGYAEDLFTVHSADPDVDQLKQIIGAECGADLRIGAP